MKMIKLKRTTLLWGLGAALAIGAFAWAFAPRPAPVEAATARQAPFEQWIEEDGQTRLRDRYRQPQEGALPHAYTPR